MPNTFTPAFSICLSIALIIFGVFLATGHFLEPAMSSYTYLMASIIAIVGGIACFAKNSKWARGVAEMAPHSKLRIQFWLFSIISLGLSLAAAYLMYRFALVRLFEIENLVVAGFYGEWATWFGAVLLCLIASRC